MDFSQFDKDSLIEYAEQNGVQIDKRWSAERIAKAIEEAESPTVSETVKQNAESLATVVVVDDPVKGIQAIGVDRADAMDAFALRIWQGQSPDLPIRERVERIKAGLVKQGFKDFSGLDLPTKENYKRYL